MPFPTHQDYENLPDSDEEAFSYLVSKIDERVGNTETDNHGNLTYMTIGDYMNEVGRAACRGKLSGAEAGECDRAKLERAEEEVSSGAGMQELMTAPAHFGH